MPYDSDQRFDAWMKDIIESAWNVIETYEAYLLNQTGSKQLSKMMTRLYEQLPVDPDRTKAGKDKDKKDKM